MLLVSEGEKCRENTKSALSEITETVQLVDLAVHNAKGYITVTEI